MTTPSASPHRHFHRVAWATTCLAALLIVFGAFVRLSHAGLSCPDWPTCYGQATWPTQPAEIARANEAFPVREVETSKAWREQVHRHIAATLGILVLALALVASRRIRGGALHVAGATLLVALSIPLYMHGDDVASGALVVAGEATLLSFAMRRSAGPLARLSTLLLAVVVFQALLGMWTVTWLLKPIVVTAHLLGGMATLSLLTVLAVWSTPGASLEAIRTPVLKRSLWIGLAVLLIQIALGGWTSANYAALACGLEYPTCLGAWWPTTDFAEAFVPWRGIGVDYEGGVLDGPARVAIQLTHRTMALLVLVVLGGIALRLVKTSRLKGWGLALGAALLAQFTLGIANVFAGLPLWMAAAHNGGAALLLFLLVALLARLHAPARSAG